jgi:hypothetical protein
MTKHTAGKWKRTPTNSHIYCDEEEKGGVIAVMARKDDVLQWVCEPASLENKANAALIAASPAMYEALKELAAIGAGGVIARSETGKPTWNAFDAIRDIARAALAQAEGKE